MDRKLNASWSPPLTSLRVSSTAAIALLLVGCWPMSVASAAEGFPIAQDGKAYTPIVVSPKASGPTKAIASELATYLGNITGATFAVMPGDGTSGIVLGTLSEFPDAKLENPLAVRNGFEGKEAFVIRTEPNRLRLIGATELGVSHAAFGLLEEIGCRWLFEAPEWEVVPTIRDLQVNVSRDERPAILARRIWYGGGLFEHEPDSRPVRDYAAWARHNRLGGSLKIFCSHVWQTIIAENKATFDEHPEYLALVGGKRQGEQFCVSNPELRKLVSAWAVEYLNKNPNADMVSLEPSDGGGQCECEACAKLGTMSDRVFGLANEAAKAVAKEDPGKLVGLYAYNEHSEPPSFALESNVYVQLTAGFTRGRYNFNELVELWPAKCKNMGFYEYLSVWPWDFDQLPGGRGNDVSYLRKQIPLYEAHGATSLDCESSGNWGLNGRGYYLTHKLMWNPSADVDALLADFYDKAFGPAAAPMRKYYERFDRGKKHLMSSHLLALGFRDLDAATKLASDRPRVQARLDHLKQYLRSVHLRWLVDRAPDKAKKKELTLAALTHGYRTRYSYMNHWVGMRDDWANRAAKEFEEPSWAVAAAITQPWAIDKPYTHDETEAEFQEGLAFFQPEEFDELRLSGDLVPVLFEKAKQAGAAPESIQTYQYVLPYFLYSVDGEELQLTLTAGTIAHYRDMAPARWTITDALGKRVAGGRLPLDGQPKSMDIEVPRPGLYRLDFEDSTAGWQIKVPPGRRAVVGLEPGSRIEHAGWMQPMYFYVPKGTKVLQYYWAGQPHRVHGPDGDVLQEVKTSGSFVKVKVPPGGDGKTWHFSQMMLGQLWLFNAPNYLAASTEALLVPRELATKDKLRIRGDSDE
jgi:hypothetical protein